MIEWNSLTVFTWLPICELNSHCFKLHKKSSQTEEMCGVECPVFDFSPSQSSLCASAQWEDGKGLPECWVSYPLFHRYAAPVPDELLQENIQTQYMKSTQYNWNFGRFYCQFLSRSNKLHQILKYQVKYTLVSVWKSRKPSNIDRAGRLLFGTKQEKEYINRFLIFLG